MSKRWIRTLAGLFAGLVLALTLRSVLLPARSALVFLRHADETTWQRAPESPLFAGAELAFAGHAPVQLAGRDVGDWHEVVIVDFATTAAFEAFVSRISGTASLGEYHLLELSPRPPEFLYLLNLKLRSDRGDASIDPGPAAPLEAAIPDARYADRWQALFEGPHRDAIVMLNLIAHRRAPADGGESYATAAELQDRYEEKALRVLGKLGAQIAVAGVVDQVVVGPEIRRYDEYGFAFYPSVDAFRTVFTAQERLDARVHRDAAASLERSAGYWIKPYAEFTPKSGD